ncbi:MAG: hypothetical protein RBQ97_07665 [Acholeplasma sp.]|nr:hypothetical protein [Acholeplasma sp.]
MKKLVAIMFVAITAITLASCGSSYKVDGKFTAFEVSVHSNNAAMVTWVDVTIKDGKVESYYIDARQGKIVDGAQVWNEKTKKELKEDYGMAGKSAIGKEWYEQAETLEAYFLEKGPEKVTTNADGYIDNVTGVSVKDGGYTKLAKEALENAKKGVTTAFEVSVHSKNAAMITWVNVTVKSGKVTAYYIDARQGKIVDGAQVWNEKTKKELKEDYGMAGESAIGKEWYEQAETLEAFFLSDGPDKVTTNEGKYIDNVTGVSVKDGGYTTLAKAALKKVGK